MMRPLYNGRKISFSYTAMILQKLFDTFNILDSEQDSDFLIGYLELEKVNT
jgi:hypothetical protein